MKKIYVVKNIPARIPLNSTILYTFLLYYFEVDRLIWGIYICLMIAYWALNIAALFIQERVDIFEEKPEKQNNKFKNRLEEYMKNKNS